MEGYNNQESTMSIFIPRVYKNISKKIIADIFEDLKYGKVKKVDLIEKMDKKGVIYHAAFIHFDYWYDNIACKNFQDRIKNPEKEARIVYKEPFYWVCLENNSSNVNSQDFDKKKYNQPKMRINLTDLYGKTDIYNSEKLDVNELFAEAALKKSIKNEENKKICKDMEVLEYVKYLEMMNYKLMYDLRNIQGDFILTN